MKMERRKALLFGCREREKERERIRKGGIEKGTERREGRGDGCCVRRGRREKKRERETRV